MSVICCRVIRAAFLSALCVALFSFSSCSSGVLFADDNQEGYVGFQSATQYSDISEVLEVKQGVVPKLKTESDQPDAIANVLGAVVESEPTGVDLSDIEIEYVSAPR